MKSKVLRIASGLVGAFIAAIVAETVMACGYAGISFLMSTSQPDYAGIGDGFLFVSIVTMDTTAMIALPMILLVALPFVLVSNRLQRFSRNYYLWSGAAMGLFVFIVAEMWQHRLFGPRIFVDFDVLFFASSSVISGAISAWVFSSIARPDTWRGRY